MADKKDFADPVRDHAPDDDSRHAHRLPGSDTPSRFDGHEHGASVSFFLSRNAPGTGPDLHRHPYEETFIVQGGRVRFIVGAEAVEAGAGEIGTLDARASRWQTREPAEGRVRVAVAGSPQPCRTP